MAAVKPIEAPQRIDMGGYTVPFVSYGMPGEEPSVVLEHGISMPATHWARFPEELAALGHHVVAVGLPEYKRPIMVANALRMGEHAVGAMRGFMTGKPGPALQHVQRMTRRHAFLPTIGGYAEDQAAAIHELTGHKPYNLLGLSFGGLMVQQQELDDSENVHRLVLAGTLPMAAVPIVDIPDIKAIAGVWSPKRSPEKSAAIYAGRFANDPGLQKELGMIIHRKIYPGKHANQLVAAAISIGPLIMRRMWQRLWQGAKPETLVLAGAEDKIVPPRTVKLAAKVLGLTLETIPHEGHVFLLSSPEEMAEKVSKSLRAGTAYAGLEEPAAGQFAEAA